MVGLPAHNLKVVSSNLTPAPNLKALVTARLRGLFFSSSCGEIKDGAGGKYDCGDESGQGDNLLEGGKETTESEGGGGAQAAFGDESGN